MVHLLKDIIWVNKQRTLCNYFLWYSSSCPWISMFLCTTIGVYWYNLCWHTKLLSLSLHSNSCPGSCNACTMSCFSELIYNVIINSYHYGIVSWLLMTHWGSIGSLLYRTSMIMSFSDNLYYVVVNILLFCEGA